MVACKELIASIMANEFLSSVWIVKMGGGLGGLGGVPNWVPSSRISSVSRVFSFCPTVFSGLEKDWELKSSTCGFCFLKGDLIKFVSEVPMDFGEVLPFWETQVVSVQINWFTVICIPMSEIQVVVQRSQLVLTNTIVQFLALAHTYFPSNFKEESNAQAHKSIPHACSFSRRYVAILIPKQLCYYIKR